MTSNRAAGERWRRKVGMCPATFYAEHCTLCKDGIKPAMVSRDARVEGVYHPRCLFQALKKINPHYRKLA